MDALTAKFYEINAESLANTYDSVSFKQVHKAWESFWPNESCQDLFALDIGAGSGRDAKWLAERGAQVVAVEPTAALKTIGKLNTQNLPVNWITDSLPEFSEVTKLGMRFDLILASAVWMHIALSERARAFRKMANLLKSGGHLIISLRHGEFGDGRTGHTVSVEELEKLARHHGLVMKLATEKMSDELGRSQVTWQTVVLSKPEDGSDNLATIRQVILNDSKSATYKLALLRTLLRIADAHPGCVLDRSDSKVAIPVGLVALYWTRQYMRLCNIGGLHQMPRTNAKLAFVKAGWKQLQKLHLGPDDLMVGAFLNTEEAAALKATFQDVLNTIKQGPVTFIYRDDKSQPLFAIERKQVRGIGPVLLDNDYFSSYGRFILNADLWDSFRVYHSWIEPLLTQEWVNEMRRYQCNIDQEQRLNSPVTLGDYYEHLKWVDAKHDTSLIRNKMAELYQSGYELRSVWSGNPMSPKGAEVDHCLPFAHWPNNDRWNLLPTTTEENRNKSDRLPHPQRLIQSRAWVLEWWQTAFSTEQERNQFFAQAQVSLPNLDKGCREFEAIYDALGLQSAGLKSRLLLREWHGLHRAP
ncbi:methyltransferase domain-containing protein [Ferrimonas sp. YFM]|uniref:methyltransferase domain-containing protein n=1 Tax=Ferrimonas sp. YFM TaxID=3028878 RepID=UPI0025733281|nr:methyltransferase domain-containing protein [Ferrimonas sp. YFM]BDY03351.1 SAM-dependent methyltransferase [Ferrimonas sp. YFM]